MSRTELTPEEKLVRQQYYREYYKIPGNEGKKALYQKRFWEKKALKMQKCE